MISLQSNVAEMECVYKGFPVDNEKSKFPKNYTGYVIMKVFPHDTHKSGLYRLFCNKFELRECSPFYPYIEGLPSMTKLEQREWPPISTQMDQKLFETIGGVVYYLFSDSKGRTFSGWLILFNIEGRPKYCFTAEGKDLSNDVRHKRQLIPNFYYSNPISVQKIRKYEVIV